MDEAQVTKARIEGLGEQLRSEMRETAQQLRSELRHGFDEVKELIRNEHAKLLRAFYALPNRASRGIHNWRSTRRR